MTRLQIPILWLRATIATLKRAEELNGEQRLRAVELITRLGQSYGWNLSLSPRRKLTREILPSVPRTRGVYRLYQGDQLTYVGVACESLHRRLRQHWNASHRDNPPDRELAEFIRAGRASAEWYVTPLPGWMEDYELTQYCEQHAGHPPEFNHMCRGGKVWHAPY